MLLLLVVPGSQSVPQDRRDDRRLTREGLRFRHRLLQELGGDGVGLADDCRLDEGEIRRAGDYWVGSGDDFLEEDCLHDGGGGYLEEEDW